MPEKQLHPTESLPLTTEHASAVKPKPVWLKRTLQASTLIGVLLYLGLSGANNTFTALNALSRTEQLFKGKKDMPYVPAPCEGAAAGDKRFDCGYFEVPLNYHDPADERKAQIAFSRYSPDIPAKEKLGTVFINPGGPGGSGYDFSARAGPSLSILQGGKYDVLGFDCRGIGRTHPKFTCFNSSTTESISTLTNSPFSSIYPHGNLTSAADIAELERGLAAYDAMDKARSASCLDPEGAREFMSTATVVRDIEHMAAKLTGPQTPINYHGFSYGTILGTYLISMFPERVGRVVIDGVADADRWWSIPHHEMAAPNHLDAMELAHEEFLNQCANAGPARCTLAYDGSSGADLGKKVDALLEGLYKRPLPVPHAQYPTVLTASIVRQHIFAGGYKPRGWPQLAIDLQEAINGNGTAIVNAHLAQVELDKTKSATGEDDAGAMVSFTDAPVFNVKDENKIPIILDQIISDHQVYTSHFAGIILDGLFNPAWNWNTSTVERFTGPVASKLSYPMLIIGNTFDNICPLHNAVRIHGMIKDSYLIHQDTAGHCSNAVTSLCTVKTLQDYFTHGILPKEDVTFCPSDEELFPAEVSLWPEHPETLALRIVAEAQRATAMAI